VLGLPLFVIACKASGSSSDGHAARDFSSDGALTQRAWEKEPEAVAEVFAERGPKKAYPRN
jgi:hypothetical protein